MTTSETLRKSVQEAIDQGRLGSPRFLRCVARAENPGQLDDRLNELASLAESWFGSRPIRRHHLGDDSRTYVSELSKWPQGQGALLTVSSAQSQGGPRLDLMLIGSRGTLYHEQ